MKETEVVRLIKPSKKVFTKTVVEVEEGNKENFSRNLLVMDPARRRTVRAYKKYVVISIMDYSTSGFLLTPDISRIAIARAWTRVWPEERLYPRSQLGLGVHSCNIRVKRKGCIER